MKLLKAREIIELNIKEASPKMPPDVKTALKISAEALAFKEAWNQGHCFPATYLLPTETKD